MTSEPPSAWVSRFAPLVAAGARVLDLACGGGRHARLFAARGCTVDAVDRDPSLAVHLASAPQIRFLCADIEHGPWPYGDARFDAVVVTRYLHRPLWPVLQAALAADGVLIYETFAQGQQAFGRPTRAEFLLQPGELLAAVMPTLSVLAFEECVAHEPTAARVQRIVAVRGELALARLQALEA